MKTLEIEAIEAMTEEEKKTRRYEIALESKRIGKEMNRAYFFKDHEKIKELKAQRKILGDELKYMMPNAWMAMRLLLVPAALVMTLVALMAIEWVKTW